MATTAASCLPALMPVAVSRLKADAAVSELLGGAKVYTLAPKNVTRPYLWLLSGGEAPDNQMGRTFRRVAELYVVAVSSFEGTEQIDAVISRVMELLDAPGEDLVLPGYGSARLQWARTEPSILAEGFYDGQPEFQRRAVFTVNAG